MRKLGTRLAMAVSTVLLCGALWAPQASAEFGFSHFDVTFTNEDGSPATQAGSHPFAIDTRFEVNNSEKGFFEWELDEEVKNDRFGQVAGFVGDATAIPRCATIEFLAEGGANECQPESQVGLGAISLFAPFLFEAVPVYILEPPPGVPVRLGFSILQVHVMIDVGVKQSPEYNVVASQVNVPQILAVFGARLQLWGNPADPAHDFYRSEYQNYSCGAYYSGESIEEVEFVPASKACPSKTTNPKPFLTLPSDCEGPKLSTWEAESWQNPGVWVGGSALTHDFAEPPSLQAFTGCGKVPFKPAVSAMPSSASAESPTGLDFNLDFAQEGLTSVDGIAQSTAKKVVATLPDGVTVNPSVGEGLGFCSPADYDRESLTLDPGKGCPNQSKIGTAEVESPLLDTNGPIRGSLYLAQQGDPATPELENPFDSLIALYIVLREPKNSIFVKIPVKVEPDPSTGQLVATADDLPQLPFSHFNLHFREGQRSPLTTPPACGSYETAFHLSPWSDPANPIATTSSFEITGGIDQGPCPPGGIPPFKPDFEAGSINNNAASYSPFNMRLIRHDGEQDMTRFGSTLPPGVVGKLAGVEKCSDQAIEAGRAKTGRQELASPSCPANSQIGRSLAGAGVGPALTYVGGKIFLAGPYKGAPLSVVSMTPAVAGPFDAGNVVVRIALDLNPETAEVEVDGASSDPIPHILKGIPLKVRDLRVYVDRDNFILNPTSCDESSAKATLFGGYLDVFSPADDVPVALGARYQAANCLNLGYKPSLKLNLRGGTKRGGHPGLKAVLVPRPGDANTAAAQATLPRSAFLDQAHIRTICTRVQFSSGAGNGEGCPAGSIYGFAKAWTPLLDEPFEGPVILRSSNNKLPDLVLALKGLVDVNVSSRIDSRNGGIRNTFDVVPDAPVSKFVLTLQGGKKGLIVNSRDLCEGRTSRAAVRLVGHNGKVANLRPPLTPQCGKRK